MSNVLGVRGRVHGLSYWRPRQISGEGLQASDVQTAHRGCPKSEVMDYPSLFVSKACLALVGPRHCAAACRQPAAAGTSGEQKLVCLCTGPESLKSNSAK